METIKQIFRGVKKNTNIKELKCENCGRYMKEYEGKYGKFIGCPNFAHDEGCKDTYSVFERDREKSYAMED